MLCFAKFCFRLVEIKVSLLIILKRVANRFLISGYPIKAANIRNKDWNKPSPMRKFNNDAPRYVFTIFLTVYPARLPLGACRNAHQTQTRNLCRHYRPVHYERERRRVTAVQIIKGENVSQREGRRTKRRKDHNDNSTKSFQNYGLHLVNKFTTRVG